MNHLLNLFWISFPVGIENTGGSWHRQQIGIGCQCIFFNGILISIWTFLSIVVLYESNCPLSVSTIFKFIRNERPVSVILCGEFAPVTIIGSISHRITELEVESGTGLASSVNPIFDDVGTGPVLTY